MGRARAFDEAALLDAAIEVFWVRGYRSASLTEVSAASGVTNGSLYQAFGSKRELFLAAYRRYCARRAAVVESVFLVPHAGVQETVAAYFDTIVDDCLAHPDRRGCLMLNTVSELGTDGEIAGISSRTVDAMEAAVARALGAVAPRSLDPGELALSAAQIVALSQALIQLSRMGRDPEELRRMGRRAARSAERVLRAA
ncbi:TetR/AcrR family transcriptional regulator [Herbiconiux sp. VKM Ac-1786]|uniref:TetR/AcrR family transcriptional regulator n=1 Tax=Herbiconiux sp. VKM Ac-1786 TaxID=2783824 RepID=UPI00188B66CC|nr:TetR/AcrR family transcriptional regulator [Herbiconiux sp. VKM Ac-1786]MBF4573426.1 TetR/AcrR family transcriptional regulator [Herbiconiux sp. VKM Ac-1786]